MKISPNFPKEDLFAAVFVNAPAGEPMKLSLVRLERAILFDEMKIAAGLKAEPDDPAPTFNAASVWTAYWRHPDLHVDYEESKRNYNDRRKNRWRRHR